MAYFKLLQERNETLRLKLPELHPPAIFMDPAFMMYLLPENGDGKIAYSGVAHFRLPHLVTDVDLIFIPVNHKNTHWSLVVISMYSNTVKWYDSLGWKGEEFLQASLDWLVAHIQQTVGCTLDTSNWRLISPSCNKQANMYDCGVFVCMYADFLADSLPVWNVCSTHMQLFRKKIAIALYKRKLSYSIVGEDD